MLARKVKTAGREILAYARQAALLPHDLGRPALPAIEPGADVVIGLHGLFASGGVMRPLRARLERHGVATAAMSYLAGPGVAALSARLGEWLAPLGAARLHLVGHSLGGVVARYYALHGGDDRVVQTISLASPFAGVRMGGALKLGLSVPLARDLEGSSPLLRELRLGRGAPHLSLVASHDHMLTAPLAHALPGGDVLVIDDCGHNAMLFDERVAAEVARRVLEFTDR